MPLFVSTLMLVDRRRHPKAWQLRLGNSRRRCLLGRGWRRSNNWGGSRAGSGRWSLGRGRQGGYGLSLRSRRRNLLAGGRLRGCGRSLGCRTNGRDGQYFQTSLPGGLPNGGLRFAHERTFENLAGLRVLECHLELLLGHASPITFVLHGAGCLFCPRSWDHHAVAEILKLIVSAYLGQRVDILIFDIPVCPYPDLFENLVTLGILGQFLIGIA